MFAELWKSHHGLTIAAFGEENAMIVRNLCEKYFDAGMTQPRKKKVVSVAVLSDNKPIKQRKTRKSK